MISRGFHSSNPTTPSATAHKSVRTPFPLRSWKQFQKTETPQALDQICPPRPRSVLCEANAALVFVSEIRNLHILFISVFLCVERLERGTMAQESWNREKEETGCQVPEGLKLCVNNCGFFGSAATMNLCSKCYSEFVLMNNTNKPLVSIPRPEAGAPEFRSEDCRSLDVSGPSSSLAVQSDPPQAPPRQTNRCLACRKRVGLTGFRCRCGDLFCALHRYSDKHNCTFDYKTAGRAAIAKANPVVKADKIQRF